jgi:peptide/nickel transport system permease protein
MLVFVIRRVLISIPVLIASTILTFVIVKLSGDPLLYLKLRQPKPPPAFINREAHRLWLDRSWRSTGTGSRTSSCTGIGGRPSKGTTTPRATSSTPSASPPAW